MKGRMNRKLALLCALVMMLTMIGGVAGAAGETGVVRSVSTREYDVLYLLFYYELTINMEKPGYITVLLGGNDLSGDYPGGVTIKTVTMNSDKLNPEVSITDALGTFSFDFNDATSGYSRPNPPAPPPAITPSTTDPDTVADPEPNYPPATITKTKSPITAYERADKTSTELKVKVQPGEAVKIIGYTYGNTWYRIMYNDGNNAGWVPAKFIKMD